MHEDLQRSSADDLSWLVGQLEFDDLEGGSWRLRFGDDSAPEGGEVVLGNPPQLLEQQPASGDTIRVEGNLDPDRMSIWMSGTIYNVTGVRVLARARETQEQQPS